ncbi:T9SS type B sorting domain-containing protein [Cellulophaga sp. F20128]|uniref:T9SS type B sorting domain-containing protein n=1 Tax=Cellulophaga sp. F20128 TaxID=2926413 RepID=UPI001FF53A9B|nr:T9SS type B sorting domain-containing protein [Cellulophaga sp. F20128]MCK0156597.1 T9SS type B sorting domain-containing protein [Cellulophaga sp. F20128]
MKKLTLLFLVLFNYSFSQFSMCEGSKGDPIFLEDFGSGTTYGPQLPAGITNYSYVPGRPSDGSYTIYHQNEWYGWHNNEDHTPNDTNGKHLIVNASHTAGEFYKRTVAGLCENTTYEFSAWLINLLPSNTGCANGGIPINIKFQILNAIDNSVIVSADTGELRGTNSPEWLRRSLTFTTPPGQTNVILQMINNGAGGCGNDLGIDDIMFRSCGDLTRIASNLNQEESIALCEIDGPATMTLTAAPDFSVYNTHAFQWQESTDNSNWQNIVGETSDTYTATNITATTYFRTKIAEDNVNLQNPLCYTVSNVYTVIIEPTPNAPSSSGNVDLCSNEPLQPLSVSVLPLQTVDWYTTATGGTAIQENNPIFLATTPGTYYAEAKTIAAGCTSLTRTAVTLTITPVPVIGDETHLFCNDTPYLLSAGVENMQYLWSTGETTENIYIENDGDYAVTITTPEGCSVTKNFNTTAYPKPVITKIISKNNNVIISLEELEGFEFSLDGITYQSDNVFTFIQGGSYTVYVRHIEGCFPITQEFIHLEIPLFFTPNGDGINDYLVFNGIEAYTYSTISVYNRFGKLIATDNGNNFSWDGRFNGQPLPSSDYWYTISIPNKSPIIGHFTLKR